MLSPNLKWLIRSICSKLECWSQKLIIPEDLFKRISLVKNKEEIILLKKEIEDLKNLYPLEPKLAKASAIINRIHINHINEKVETLDNKLYWNVIELSNEGIIYGIHVLTKNKITESKLNDIFGEIVNNEFKIDFISKKDLNKKTEVEFNIPYFVPEYKRINFLIGTKEQRDFIKKIIEKVEKSKFYYENFKK